MGFDVILVKDRNAELVLPGQKRKLIPADEKCIDTIEIFIQRLIKSSVGAVNVEVVAPKKSDSKYWSFDTSGGSEGYSNYEVFACMKLIPEVSFTI